MSDEGRTEPLPARDAAGPADQAFRDERQPRYDPDPQAGDLDRDVHGERGTRERSSHDRNSHDPIAAAKDPDNRAKLMLATAAMTLLNLLLLIAVLTNVLDDDGSFEQVTVDGQNCVVETGGNESILFCQR
jgi:hypothetical protein